jgi:hypothetical protein
MSSGNLRAAAAALASFCAFMLVACGGGGGGSSSGSSSSSSSGGGTGGSGGFTLSATSATFKTLRRDPLPADSRIAVTITGSKVAAFGAATVNQAPPAWLKVAMEGTSPNLTLVLGVQDTSLAAGHYSTSIEVGTADAGGTVLSHREVVIDYDVIEGMDVSGTPLAHHFVFGSSVEIAPMTVTVGAPGKTWTVTSNQPWLTVPGGSRTGDSVLNLTVNGGDTGQAPGTTATAQLVFQNANEPIDRRVLTVTAEIAQPLISVSGQPLRSGCLSGLVGTRETVELSLDTGSNTYPWSVSFDAAQSGWLGSDATTGTLGGALKGAITLRPTASIGGPGNYTATANFDVVVRNQTFRTSVPVTMKWHGQRLVPELDGVAFSSIPSRPQPAQRVLRVLGGRGVDNVPWTANSNQSWLTVTSSGVTGGTLTLTANPAGLAPDTVHVADVTLSSTSANIERAEHIRVGLWVGSANPANAGVGLSGSTFGLVVNPVEPFAYVLTGGQVQVYNVYTRQLINTFTNGIAASFGSLAISSDGSTLYHENNSRIIGMNATTGAQVSSFEGQPRFGSPLDSDLLYARVDGYPILFTPAGDIQSTILDLETGTELEAYEDNVRTFIGLEALRMVSPDGSRLFTINDATTANDTTGYDLGFGVLGGRTLQLRRSLGFAIPGGSFIRRMCINASGTRAYTTFGVLDEVDLTTSPPHHLRQILPPQGASTNALVCHPNGRLYVGLSTISSPQNNAFALDANGGALGSFLIGPADSGVIVGQMGMTGDARRIVSTHVESGNPSPIITAQFYDVP